VSKYYQQALAMLDELTPAELVAMLEQITIRLQFYVGPLEEEAAEDREDITRRYLPRLPQMIQWGLVVPTEDTLFIKDIPEQPALLLDASRVAYQGETMSINDWAKHITGWKAVNVYEWVVVKRQDRTLDDLRRAYMDENGME
jgi:hypothetical protein